MSQIVATSVLRVHPVGSRELGQRREPAPDGQKTKGRHRRARNQLNATPMTSLAVVLLLLAALSALCLAMPRHRLHAGAGALRLPAAHTLRTGAVTALAAGVALAVSGHGLGVGLVLWCAALTPAAVCVVLCASYRPRWLRRLMAGGAAGGVAAAAISSVRWL